MLVIIKEGKGVDKYLKKRNLLSRYKKVKKYLLNSDNIYKKLKKRKPKKEGIYQFKINRQYRAYCVFSKEYKDTIIVFKISDHQE